MSTVLRIGADRVATAVLVGSAVSHLFYYVDPPKSLPRLRGYFLVTASVLTLWRWL
jgi:hypothetical protein